MTYLGHIITEDGLQPDPKTTKSLVNFPVPRNAKDVKSFLGLAGYYRRFIRNFSQIAKPMTNQFKKDVEFNWDDLCQKSFEHLKE